MEIIKITKTIEVTGYKAFDGTVFDDRDECVKYELGKRNIIIKDFSKIVVKVLEGYEMTTINLSNKTCTDRCPLCGCGEDWYYALIKIKDYHDLTIAMKYQELAYSKAERKFSSDDIGKELIVTIGECYGDHCYIWGTIDECVENYRKSLMMFKDDNVKTNKYFAENNKID